MDNVSFLIHKNIVYSNTVNWPGCFWYPVLFPVWIGRIPNNAWPLPNSATYGDSKRTHLFAHKITPHSFSYSQYNWSHSPLDRSITAAGKREKDKAAKNGTRFLMKGGSSVCFASPYGTKKSIKELYWVQKKYRFLRRCDHRCYK